MDIKVYLFRHIYKLINKENSATAAAHLLSYIQPLEGKFQVLYGKSLVVGVSSQPLKTFLGGLSVRLREGRCSIAQRQPVAQCIAQLTLQPDADT